MPFQTRFRVTNDDKIVR